MRYLSRTVWIALFLSALPMSAPAQQAAATEPELVLDRAVYEIGEPVTFTLQNRSHATFLIDPSPLFSVSPMGFKACALYAAPDRQSVLAPNASLSWTWDQSLVFPDTNTGPARAGRFHVTIWWKASSNDPIWTSLDHFFDIAPQATDRVVLITNKRSYAPGETVRMILLNHETGTLQVSAAPPWKIERWDTGSYSHYYTAQPLGTAAEGLVTLSKGTIRSWDWNRQIIDPSGERAVTGTYRATLPFTLRSACTEPLKLGRVVSRGFRILGE